MTENLTKIKEITEIKEIKENKFKIISEKDGDKIYEWRNKNIKGKIVLTVALPVYRGKNIIWLALESLRKQTKINFYWELIIIEEFGHSFNIIETFLSKFPYCNRVIYKSLNNKILLIHKWISISKLASLTSNVYVLQAADCYSPPKRLYIHQQHFVNNKCYFSTQVKGIFFNLINKKSIIYNGRIKDKSRKFITSNHLNMALRTQDMKRIKPINKNRGIDRYIRESIIKLHKININTKYIFTDSELDKNNWKYSLDTDGCNNISLKRRRMYSINKVNRSFVPFNAYKNKYGYLKMTKYIPINVIKFINKLKIKI